MLSRRKLLIFSLAGLLGLVPTLADAGDDPAPAAPGQGKLDAKPGAGYVLVGDIVGTVVKADADSLVLRITQLEVTGNNNGGNIRPGNNRPGNIRPGSKVNPAQQQQQQMRRVLQAIQQQMRRAANVKVKEKHQDYDLPFLSGVTVRSKIPLPKREQQDSAKSDTDKGVKEAPKAKDNLPGFPATVADLQPGQIVEVFIVQPKAALANKTGPMPPPAIRSIVILGQGKLP